MISVDSSAIMELGQDFEKLSDAVLDENLSQGAFIAGSQVQSEARSLVAVDTGALKISVDNSVRRQGSGYLIEVGPTQPYGADVEYGQPPGTFVPASALAGWAKRKGLNPYVISKAIADHGTKPQPFMGPALDAKQESVVEVLAQAVINAFNKVFGSSK
jgi:HK97 gp10 family phage protein